jgi:hypothetical protein
MFTEYEGVKGYVFMITINFASNDTVIGQCPNKTSPEVDLSGL